MTPSRRALLVETAVMALVAGAALAATAYLLLYTDRGQRLDWQAKHAIVGPQVMIHRFLEGLSLVSVGSVGLALLACLVLATARRRFAIAVGALVLVAGANVTTQVLKYAVLSRPDHGLGTENTLPSGHSTVALSLALAAVLVAPAAWRSAVTLLGATGATLVGAGTVIAGWHRPGDVLAAIAVCLLWGAIALALTAFVGTRRPAGAERHPIHLSALVGASAVGALVVAWGVRPVDGVRGLELAVVSLSAIGLGCAVAVAAVAHVVDRHLG